jgi:polysaccharide deacetylase family protein (PEP-CTERM system associated)
MKHALSIDVEDWYHDFLVDSRTPRMSRVEANTMAVLDILEAQGVKATFFFLGDVADRFPALVRRVAAAGNEVASHGYRHYPVTRMTPREFRSDVRRSQHAIEDAIGRSVLGYRAPYFSIKAGVHWPIEILKELGVRYDASMLPIDRPPGMKLACPRRPFRHANGVWEVPVATVQLLTFLHLPLAGGNGLRWLPRGLSRRLLRRFERDVGAGVFYLHPWELDPGSPVAPRLSRWFLRVGRRRVPARLRELLQETPFAPIVEVFAAQLGDAATAAQLGGNESVEPPLGLTRAVDDGGRVGATRAVTPTCAGLGM